MSSHGCLMTLFCLASTPLLLSWETLFLVHQGKDIPHGLFVTIQTVTLVPLGSVDKFYTVSPFMLG